MNCSTNCPSSKKIILETSLSKELVGNGTGWAAFQLSNVTGNSRILCSGYCDGSQITGFSDITVYSESMCPEVGLVLGSGVGRWPMAQENGDPQFAKNGPGF